MTPGLLPSWLGTRVYDRDGARLGYVGDVLFDDHRGTPDWLLVVLLRADRRFVLVPARGAHQHPRGVVIPVHRALVRTAPTTAAPPDALTAAHAHRLARHYEIACGPGPWTGVAEPSLGFTEERVRMHVRPAA